MKKKIGFYITGALLLTGLILLHPFFNGTNPILSYTHNLTWGNVLDLELDDNLAKENVTITFKNEFALFRDKNPMQFEQIDERFNYKVIHDTIILNGKQTMDVPYDYGKQELIVFYEGKEIGSLGLFKTNNWHSHRYKFNVFKTGEEIKMTGEISGPDISRFFIKSK